MQCITISNLPCSVIKSHLLHDGIFLLCSQCVTISHLPYSLSQYHTFPTVCLTILYLLSVLQYQTFLAVCYKLTSSSQCYIPTVRCYIGPSLQHVTISHLCHIVPSTISRLLINVLQYQTFLAVCNLPYQTFLAVCNLQYQTILGVSELAGARHATFGGEEEEGL